MRSVVFRTDASITIGAGHVMRCLTLADELKCRDIDSKFVCRSLDGDMSSIIRQRGYKCVLLPEPDDTFSGEEADCAHADWLGVDWRVDAEQTKSALVPEDGCLIVDHYGIDFRWHKALRGAVEKIVVIDDLADRMLDCDLILDQTYAISADRYQELVPKGCVSLLGSGFALLRPEFSYFRPRSIARREREAGIHRILISMGAMDLKNITCQVLDGLAQLEWMGECVVDVVLGGSAPHIGHVRQLAEMLPYSVNILVDVANMAELMCRADLAVGAAGATTWERCCLGLPALVVETASNQKDVLASLSDTGSIISLGRDNASISESVARHVARLHQDSSCLKEMARNAMEICDGRGAARVTFSLFPERAKDGARVHLRNVTIDDAEVIFQWQSMSETRRYSNNPEAPAWPEHFQWMQNKLNDRNSFQYMIMHDDDNSGVVRLDLDEEGFGRAGYVVSIFVAPEKYRLGLGAAALKIVQRLFPLELLYAQVHHANAASRALFERAGFVFDAGLDMYVYDCARTA